ncbi:A/G-specific adenine glycosylase [Methylobacillus flagellatus]|uniref:A/G-specific adenine glycosylase n=1 Tax=Methylobacillus flagellatus TaxID=405 RepID=UPI0010F4A347|nr:A/G-specific adenine glycosylase [Methylobacillus flagellatus]
MSEFATALIAWQKQSGRHDLPWQNTHDPYAIWVSEIMLQQTQVSAVIGYYARFMQRFPDIASLAAADQDSVLQHWSGLGYYSRARNLHKAAQRIVAEHDGVFPQQLEAIVDLPGIGRSTAAAVAAFAFGQRQAILDGNVKRVLARHALIEGWPGLPRVEKQLWALAESLLPAHDIHAYTQGLMDLGATLCTRSKPRCDDCPLRADCGARLHQRTTELPHSKPRKTLPQRDITMLLLLHDGRILLEKRPDSGIWGGLWSLPELACGQAVLAHVQQRFGILGELLAPMPELQHTFSHFRLNIQPQPVQIRRPGLTAAEPGIVWLPLQQALEAALPTPIRTLLQQLLVLSGCDLPVAALEEGLR